MKKDVFLKMFNCTMLWGFLDSPYCSAARHLSGAPNSPAAEGSQGTELPLHSITRHTERSQGLKPFEDLEINSVPLHFPHHQPTFAT